MARQTRTRKMTLIVTRPEPDGSSLAARLEAAGHSVLLSPLITISFRAAAAIPKRHYQAIAVTSANGIRGLKRLRDFGTHRHLPVYAVGDASAEEAARAGFEDIVSARGDLSSLAELIEEALDPGSGDVLYVTGGKIAGDLAGRLGRSGFTVERAILYDALPAPENLEVHEAVRNGKVDGVLLMSPRTAVLWCGQIEKADLVQQASGLAYFCLSDAVAHRLAAGLKAAGNNIVVAEHPTLPSLLDLLGG